MGVDFTVFKGSASGEIVEAKGHREPRATEVLVKISHCGVCGTDEHYRHADQGLGHESVGIITEVGSAVHELSDFRVGDRVGMGWFHRTCGYCDWCLSGRQNECPNQQIFGTHDQDQGGFGTALAWDISALYKIPDAIASEHAGPLMCGGATVFHPLFTERLNPGSRVGIIGLGGLGHLAVQFANKMGLDPIVFSGTGSKREAAKGFGAAEFHVTGDGPEKADLSTVGKVNLLLLTANVLADLKKYIPVLAPGARIYALTISTEPMNFSPLDLIMGSYHLIGSGIASRIGTKTMLEFAAKHNIRPQIEKFPMSKTGIVDAMQKLRDGKMRYRGVLVV